MQVICEKYKECSVKPGIISNCYHAKAHIKSDKCELPSENCGKCTINGLRLKKLKKLNKINAGNL